jgi:hypothetical protein
MNVTSRSNSSLMSRIQSPLVACNLGEAVSKLSMNLRIARPYLTREFGPLQIGTEIARLRAAAGRLVRDSCSQERIQLIADALLRHGTLRGTR